MQASTLPQVNAEAFQLSLRIRHPSMDPAEISRALKMEAAHSFRAGARRAESGGHTVYHRQSYWLGMLPSLASLAALSLAGWSELARKQAEAAGKSHSWALVLSAARFLSLHGEFLRRIRSEGGELALLITIDGAKVGALTLAPEASRVFGELGIAIEFEIASE